MGPTYDGKKRWNETVLLTNANAAKAAADARRNSKKKRVSDRTVKLSKAMRNVDDETRAIVRNARLDALEADNYGADDALAGDGDGDPDDVYVDEEMEPASVGKKKKSKAKAASKTTATSKKTKRWKVKSLAQLVFEEHGHSNEAVGSTQQTVRPTYLSIAAAASRHPPRKFCVVCGFFAPYQCRRCGTRYCRVKCGDQHQESGCLKFGL